jgi:hypothetical protein
MSENHGILPKDKRMPKTKSLAVLMFSFAAMPFFSAVHPLVKPAQNLWSIP